MEAFIAIIAKFFGEIFKAILPDLIKESKQPTEVHTAGYDEELVDELDKSIEDALEDDEYSFLSNEAHAEGKDQPNE